jgi:hypothetical protein
MACMTLTSDLLQGIPVSGENYTWIRLLVIFDVIFTALSIVFIDTVLIG